MSAKSSLIMIQCKGCDKYFNVDTPSTLVVEYEDGKKETHASNEEYLCMSCTNLIMLPRALCGNLCEICGKIFSSSDRSLEGIITDLTSHITSHSQDTLYRCVYCGRVFLRSLYLKVHQRIHTGEKPHVCHLCSDKFITMYLLHKHTQEKHATVQNMMSRVAEMSEEEDEEEDEDRKEEDDCLKAMIPEVKMEVISDEEVDTGEHIQAGTDLGDDNQGNEEIGDYDQVKVENRDYNHTDVNKDDSGQTNIDFNNPSALSLLSAIQGHHNISSSSETMPSIMFINAPEHFLTPLDTSDSGAVQNRPLNSIAMQRLPTVAESSSQGMCGNISVKSVVEENLLMPSIKLGNVLVPSIPQRNVLMPSVNLGNVLVPTIPPLNHCLMQPFSVDKNQTLQSSMANLPTVPEFSIYPNFLVQSLAKAKLDRQKLYIKQIESLEGIDFLELRSEDVTIGLVFVIHEKKRANKLELTWEGVAEYFRNIFQMSHLNGRQLSRSFISVAKRYELKKSQNSLENYATCRYYPPGYNDANMAFARILSRFGLDLCNIPTMMLTNEYILKIIYFLLSGNCQNSVWIYIYQCISKILDWRGPEQILINGIIDVGNKCNKLLTDDNHNPLIAYLNQLFTPTILAYQNGAPLQNESIQKLDCVNDSFVTGNLEMENNNLINEKVELEKESNLLHINPILRENKCYQIENLNGNVTKDFDVKSYSTKSPISVRNFRSYLSEEIEKQYNGKQQNKSNEDEISKFSKSNVENIDKDNENEYESIESLLISGDENENAESSNSKPTIEEYLKLYNDKDSHTNSHVKCKQIKDMIFSSDTDKINKEILIENKKRTDSIAENLQINRIPVIIQKPKVTHTSVEDELSDINTNMCAVKEHLFSTNKTPTNKRKIIVGDKTRIVELDSKRHKVNTSQIPENKNSELVPLLPLNLKLNTEYDPDKVEKSEDRSENLAQYEKASRVRAPILTKNNFTNFVARKMYEKMTSSKDLKEIYLPDLTNSVINIFELPNLMQQDVFHSFQQVYETSNKLSSDKEKFNIFLNSSYKPPIKEMHSDPDHAILSKLNKVISQNIKHKNLTYVSEDSNKSIDNNNNFYYDDNNNDNFLVKPHSLLPNLSDVRAENFSNRIAYEIYKASTQLSYEMKIKFWFEMRETYAQIFGINDINIYSVCQKYLRVHTKALNLQNNPTQFDTYLSSTFKYNMYTRNNILFRKKDNNSLERLDHHMQSDSLNNQQETDPFNMYSLPVSISNPDILPKNQAEESGAETFHTNTISEDDSNINMKDNESNPNMKDGDFSPNMKDNSSPNTKDILLSEADILDTRRSVDDSDSIDQDITQCSNSKEMRRQHQEMLDIFGLEELTQETFINGVAWKIFKEMKTGKNSLLPSWEKVAIFIRNIYQNRNIMEESLKENFEEIFTHCQLLKAKKELTSLKIYFNTLYTFPTQEDV